MWKQEKCSNGKGRRLPRYQASFEWFPRTRIEMNRHATNVRGCIKGAHRKYTIRNRIIYMIEFDTTDSRSKVGSGQQIGQVRSTMNQLETNGKNEGIKEALGGKTVDGVLMP